MVQSKAGGRFIPVKMDGFKYQVFSTGTNNNSFLKIVDNCRYFIANFAFKSSLFVANANYAFQQLPQIFLKLVVLQGFAPTFPQKIEVNNIKSDCDSTSILLF